MANCHLVGIQNPLAKTLDVSHHSSLLIHMESSILVIYLKKKQVNLISFQRFKGLKF